MTVTITEEEFDNIVNDLMEISKFAKEMVDGEWDEGEQFLYELINTHTQITVDALKANIFAKGMVNGREEAEDNSGTHLA